MSKVQKSPAVVSEQLTHDEWLARLNEEVLTPAEVLDRLKVSYKKNPEKKVYELTRRRGNRPPMPSHRVGKQLRFYWSEIRRWQSDVQQLRAAA